MSLVYVIEDDRTMRNAVAMLLEAEGFAVKTFASARDFMARVIRRNAGCILTDMRLRDGMTGLDVLWHVSAWGPHWPVVFLTGHGDDTLREKAFAGGAVEFLEKPCPAEVLIGAVQKALVGRGPGRPTAMA